MPYTKPCLLLVDDEPANLRVMKQILQHDYHLIFAKSGTEAIRLTNEKKTQSHFIRHHDARHDRARGM